eukprot:Ihof_evm3s221 gene=Ihof_evmTU3s221
MFPVRFLDHTGTVRVGEPLEIPIGSEIKRAREFDSGDIFEIVKFLPPTVPSNIICIGLNYQDHRDEVNLPLPRYPVVFTKTTNALIGHNECIELPMVGINECDYEGELAVVIGEDCKNVPIETALDHVYGYTIANDITARRWQGKKGGGQWVRSKSFDTFGPIGPVMVSPKVITNPNTLSLRTKLNGNTVQESSTSKMIFPVADLISFLSQDTTLLA